MRGMRTAGKDFSTDFGELKASGTELPLARMQTSEMAKQATYFDIYDLRVTCETRAGISDVNYSAIINLLHDANVRYREERRYNVQPDRVIMEILIQKEDIPAVNDLNKEYGDKGYKFTFNDNLPEDIQDRIITTPEKELEVKVTEKSANKKTAADEEDPLGVMPETENETETAGESQVDYESEVLPVLKEKLDDAFESIETEFELYGAEEGGSEVEHQGRDGFIPFTNGGYEVSGFTSVDMLMGTGRSVPSDTAQKDAERIQDDAYTESKAEFIKSHPEIVAELGEDNIDYNTLQDKGYGNEAEELSEAERSYMEVSILLHITAYYYEPGNTNSDHPESDSIYIKYAVNNDYDYHREKGDNIVSEADFAFNTPEELGQKLDEFLAGINATETVPETPVVE